MILEIVYSINDVPIRLTDERWEHIVDRRPYLASYLEAVLDAVESPEYILPGQASALVAVVSLGKNIFLHVIYRELSSDDGFIITAYVRPTFDKRRVKWRRDG